MNYIKKSIVFDLYTDHFFVVFLLGFLTNLFANQSVAAHPFTENIQSEEELVIEENL